ncbi:MAG: T9SS type A sorting domain-containing protein [bacterium]
MPKIFIIILIFISTQTKLHSQEYWLKQQSPTINNLSVCFFTDSLRGWIGGDSGIIIHTTNKGQSWSFQKTGVTYNINSIFFLNERNGYALSWEIDFNPPNFFGTRILSTSNGGESWSNYLFPDTNLFLNTIYFRDSLNGYIGGTGGKIYYTTNAGNTWALGVIDSGLVLGFPVKEIKFINADNGFAVGGGFDIAGVIWNTTNGGVSWNTRIVGPEPLNDIHIFDPLNIIAVGGDYEYGSSNVKTSNGGIVWNYDELGVFGIPSAIAFRTHNEAWVPLSIVDKFLLSFNGGSNWEVIDTPDSSIIVDMFFSDQRNGWAVGNNGVILKYNSELVGITTHNIELPESIQLYQNYPNPFNPATIINYDLHYTGIVKLEIFNITGARVATLVNQKQNAGSYSIEWNAENFPSGIYYYKLGTGESIKTRKLVLLK